jgi:Fe-S cluster assembly scaffold protein SufB
VIENLNVYPERGMTDREAAQMVVRGLRRAERDGAI